MQIKHSVQEKVCEAGTNKHEENSALCKKRSNKTKVYKTEKIDKGKKNVKQ